MIEFRANRPAAITSGADNAYDDEHFAHEVMLSMNMTTRVAQNTGG
ncbi:hypothetical protein I6F31_05180 [Bradyrhizobium sp. NBAIM01]|nr:hypothetical protein [Bradyrhizobium sp. NBAIM01]